MIDVVAKPEQADLVALLDQRARDVELGLVARLDLLLPVLRRGRLAVRVEENEHAMRLLHSPTLILDRPVLWDSRRAQPERASSNRVSSRRGRATV